MNDSQDENLSSRCLLCGQPLPTTRGLPLCPEHLRLIDRDEDRTDARGWLFRHGEGDWLLFRAQRPVGGAPRMGWKNEWKAVNKTSLEVRHFPRAEEIEIWIVLLGAPSIPIAQAAATLPDFSDAFTFLPDARLQQQFAIFCHDLLTSRTPVYVPEQPMNGLMLGSMQASRKGNVPEVTSVTFASLGEGKSGESDQDRMAAAWSRLDTEFVARAVKLKGEQSGKPSSNWGWFPSVYPSPPSPFPSSVLKLTYAYDLTYAKQWDEDLPDDRLHSVNEYIAHVLLVSLLDEARTLLSDGSCRRLCKHAADSFWEYAPDLVHAAEGESVKVLKREFAISGKDFEGELIYWSLSRPVCAFRLSRIEAGPVVYRLDGEAYNLSLDQLLLLIENLTPLNGRADIVARYAEELAQKIKRLQF